jgi:Tfp pilus assembly protein PilF
MRSFHTASSLVGEQVMSVKMAWYSKMLAGGVLALAVSSTTGCMSAGSSAGFWGSMNPFNWFAAKPATPTGSLAQKPLPNAVPAQPSPMGANSRLGANPPRNNSWLSSMTAPLTGSNSNGSRPLTPGDEALQLDSQPKHINPQIFVQMARVYEAKGDYAAALKQYEQALRVAPNNTEVLLGMARAYDRRGDYPQAVATYEEAAKLDPKNGIIFNDLGLCHARHEDLKRAQQNLSQAVGIAPTSQLYRNNLATVLVQQGQYDAALDQLKAVLPEPAAHYNIGFLAERFGNRAVALQHFQQAATLDPNLLAARQMMEKLQSAAGSLPNLEQLSNQAQSAVNQAQQSATSSLQATELKIRNAIQAQTSNLAPRYAEPIHPPGDSYTSDFNPGSTGPVEAETNATPPTTTTPKTTQPLPPLD